MRLSKAAQSLDRGDEPAAAAHARGNRRRLKVFAGVFAVCLLAGMAWNLLRPAAYRSVARLQLTLPAAAPPASAAAASGSGADLVSQVERMRSRPLLEQVLQRLAAAGQTLPQGQDPVAQLESMIDVTPVPDSTVIELTAVGAPPALIAAALNGLLAAYAEQLQVSSRSSADLQLEQTRDELARLERSAGERRSQLERFRAASGILSSEREDNASVALNRGLATALNTALEKQANAEARLRAMQDSVAGGKGAALARDDPTLASLESRISQMREELREIARTHTEAFLAIDPRARALRTRLDDLGEQLAQRRVVSQQQALATAQEDLATAQASVQRLQSQQVAERQSLRSFTAGFARVKALEDDLASIERARREALERLTRLEASELAQRAGVEVLQPASVPDRPWRPDYWRDGVLVAGASFVAGLLAMGFVELFNRAPPAMPAAPMTTVVLPGSWPGLGVENALPRLAPWPAPLLPAGVAPPVLAAPPPRELEQAEAAALIAATRGTARLACAAGLLGLSTAELMALRHRDIDRAARSLHVGGAPARRVALPDWLVDEWPAGADGDAPLLADAGGQALGSDELRTLVLCGAVDAGLAEASQVTPELLRHTALAWLVRAGMRFADLPSRMGRIDAHTIAGLAALAADVPRRAADEIDPLMPALRLPPPAG